MKIQRALLIGGVLLAFSMPVQAASVAFMNQTILSSIPKQDRPDFRAAVTQLLDTQPDGAASTWTGSTPRHGLPVTVKMTVERTTETQKANKCRLLDALVSQGNRSEKWAFWFCKQESGEWKASRH
ncbi:MAG TPA: hypothetical protein VEA17_02065 [Bordetella sp.]|nr:hypothetical protein [Bordetella sp.]